MIKHKIIFGMIVVSMSLFLVNIINVQASEYSQIIEQVCNECTICPDGFECINFPNIGSRCAEPDPCSYYQCSLNTECNILKKEIAMICSDGRNVGAVPRLICECVGPECPDTGGEIGISYNVEIGEVEIIKGSKKTLIGVTLRTAPGYDGILDTPVASAKLSKEVVIEDSKLLMKTSIGKKIINIMPEDAIAVSGTPDQESIQEIELKEEVNKPIYLVRGTKRAKLFFFIPVSMKIESKIDAEAGKILTIKKPWWSFLAWQK